jgi:Pro-Pro endopeptidase
MPQRKFMLFTMILIISVPLLGNTQASVDGVYLRNFPVESYLQNSLTLQSNDQLGDIVLLPKESFDQQEVASIIERLDHLPPSMLVKINQQQIKLKLFEGKLTDNPTAKHLKGVKPRGYVSDKTWDDVPGVGGSKTVLVKIGASEKGNGHGSVNLELHELAHSVDRYVYDEIRQDPNFLKVWEAEREALFPGKPYFTTLPEEYFAETFAMFYLGIETKEELKQKAPKTFMFYSSLN